MASFKLFRRGSSAMSGLLNVLGMAVAFAAFYIILVQVNYDLNFNKGIKDSEKVYMLVSGEVATGMGKKQLNICRPLAEMILQNSPNIEYGGVFDISYSYDRSFGKDNNGETQVINLKGAEISGTALKAAGFEAVAGSLDDVVNQNTLAISESAAERFDLEVGTELITNGEICTVVAIFKKMPENTHFKGSEVIWNIADLHIDNYSEWGYNYIFKVYDPSQKEDMEKEFSSAARKYYQEQYFGQMPSPEEMGMTQEEFDEAVNFLLDKAQFSLVPIDELYFTEEIHKTIESGNRTTTTVLLIVAILIVGIAFINYINFFFALIPERIKSVNTKKVLGSTRRELIISTISESLILIATALAFAFVLVMLFNMSQLTHLISADTKFAMNMGMTIWTIIISAAIAVVASLYPAFYITSFEPAMVLKGSFGATKAGKSLRYGLIGLQFVISIVLIICSSFITLQRRYMVNFDMGFDKEQLLYVHTTNKMGANADAVEEQLKNDPQIADVCWTNGVLLASERMGWGRDWNGQMVNFQCYPVSWDFPEFMGLEILEGRTFLPKDNNSENGVFIFNDAARRTYGFTLEDRVAGHMDSPAEIAGFCNDFSFMTLKEDVQPFALYVFGKNPWYYPSTIFIRVAAGADYKAVMKHIAGVLSEWEPWVEEDQWAIHFFDENLNNTYRKEENLSLLISLFTLVAIIISLMGVFGLVMFETQYRRREIALRRVNGATVRDILGMFAGRFVKIVLVCFAVGGSVAWIIVNRYLATFAHRCPMYWWVFALALVAVMAVTVGVVVLRSWNAATADPADALKTE